MRRLNVAAALVAGALLVSSGSAALAQTRSAAEPPLRTGLPPMALPPVDGGANDSRTHAVLRVTSVEIMRSAHAPALDIIRARGLASSAGWEEAELVPLTRGVPADGILQLILVARPPEVASDATGYETVEAILPLETDHPFKGVNVHAATNAVGVTTLPGYAESKSALDDCGKCVGKTFVARGGAESAGRSDVVREQQLPPEIRIVRPSDGIPGGESNPNRLTLILDKDSRIVTAVWE
jgi:hypothetical protein